MTKRNPERSGSRRTLALIFALLLLAGGGWLAMSQTDSSLTFASAAMLRIGLVLGMLWLAWPSLKRPARWLPPGIAMLVVLSLVVIAAQPRLILVVLPVAGGLISLGAVVRAFRSAKQRK